MVQKPAICTTVPKSRNEEAQAVREIYKTRCAPWEKEEKLKSRNVECRILMPEGLLQKMVELKQRKKKRKGIYNFYICDSVVSYCADDVDSVAKSLLALLDTINYSQATSELKMILPAMMMKSVEMPDSASNELLPNCNETVSVFTGDHQDMVRGVRQCLELMEKNSFTYGGLGSRYLRL